MENKAMSHRLESQFIPKKGDDKECSKYSYHCFSFPCRESDTQVVATKVAPHMEQEMSGVRVGF